MQACRSGETRDTVRLLVGWEAKEFPLGDPNWTLLQLLREDFGLTGTKEGCAEGDCGACTVLVGRLVGGRLAYRAVNACILFTGALDGCQVLTVEHIALDGLHPAQEAMAAEGGSQCGFCTPGFVMSLVGMHVNGAGGDGGAERGAIDAVLAGNLCRCTGYGPIIAAARRVATAPVSDAWTRATARAEETLREWAADPRPLFCQTLRGFFAAPRSRADLACLMAAHPEATLVAGATDVGLWVTKQGKRLDKQIYLGAVGDLHNIRQTDDAIEIGAAVTYAEAETALLKAIPALAPTFRRIGSTQVRNSGTIGGNIANASPIGDTPPPLIALGATLVLESADGMRELPLERYFLDYGRQDRKPGEFVAAVRVPTPVPDSFRCYKVSKRFEQDITAVLGAFVVLVSDGTVVSARLAFGGMAGTPMRARRAEAALADQPWTMETVSAAMDALGDDFTPMTDMRASADYRLMVARNLLERYFHDLAGGLASLADGAIAEALCDV